MAGQGDPAALDGALVRICDLAGRPRGMGFAADDHGTVITSHEAVDGLARLVLHAAGERVCVVTADSVVALPEADLALVRTEGLCLRPLPVTVRETTPVGAYVRIVARGRREARVLGPAPVTYTATDRFHLVDAAMELAIGTDGADALRLGGGAAGGPVVDVSSGAVLAVLGTALHSEHRAAGFAVPLREAAAADPGGPLAELLARNAATVPAYGRDLNLAGALHLAATSVGSDGPRPALLEPVERPDTTRELADFTAGPAQVLGLVGDPGTGRTTELAALAALRSRGAEPAPTLWLRGADLQGTDTGVGDAVERALQRAGRILEASEEALPEADDGLGDISAGRVARLVRDEGRALLLLLDGPEEMPPVLAHRLAQWSGGTAEWLRETGARLVVGCRSEYWEQAGAHFPASLSAGCVELRDLPERQARIARARYGIPDGALAAADARHPLALRLLAEVRAALPEEPPPGCPDREEIFEAYLDVLCLRVAVRLAAANGVRGAAVRRLAAKVSGQVHEAARRCLGPGQGELDRASFEEVFPWGAGWASAVLTEGLLVPAGDGYRFAHEELADWIQGMHLDVDGALWSLVYRYGPAAPDTESSLPVPRHRIGPVIQALLLLGRQRGPAELEARLRDLARFGEPCAAPDESDPGIQGCAHPPPLSAALERGDLHRPAGRLPTAAGTAAESGATPAGGNGEAARVVGRRSAGRLGSPLLERSRELGEGWAQPQPPGAEVAGGEGNGPVPPGADVAQGGGCGPVPPGVDVAGEVGHRSPPSGADWTEGGGSGSAPPGAYMAQGGGCGPVPPGVDVAGEVGHRSPPSGADWTEGGGSGPVPPRAAAQGCGDAQWWAGHLLVETLQRVADASLHLGLLQDLAQQGSHPAEFWLGLPLAEDHRFDLLREAVIHDPPPGTRQGRCLDAVAELLATEPEKVQPQLTRWFTDERPLAATPHATVASAAQALLHTHRHRAIDDLTEILVDCAHPRADELLAALAEEEPSAVCRAVDRWVHDERPARRVAAVAYGLRAAPHATTDADHRLLRYTAFALLARTADDTLHGAALALLVRDPQTRARHLPPALKRFTAGDPQLPASALVTALDTHPEQILAAFRTRLYGPGPAPGDVLRALADVTAPGLARRVADLVRDVLELRPDLAGHVAAFLDLRFEQGPGVRAVLHPLVTAFLRHHTPPVRAALAAALAAPGTDASRALRTELLDVLLDQEREPEVLDAVLCAVAGGDDKERVRDLVHRTGVLLVRTPEGATCFDRRLVELARSVAGFSTLVSRWIRAAPQDWSALVGPSARRMIENLAGARVPA
ncbi:trypsin-like peptidase domain-containing protein [Streptomyces sp. NPDC002855]|uniref:trypsin-like peptidase domain-containing protein n=1 Tax=Streptomyces sp. NPDC002855 TaxID=3154437 RepID=UPI003321E9C4